MNEALSPLELPGWVEFNVWRTGFSARRWTAPPADGPTVSAVLYVDRRDRIRLPPSNPYLPVTFSTRRERPSSRTAEWLRMAAPLAAEMKRRGVVSQIYLPPEIDDVRPWLWSGFLVDVDYTYCVDLPFDEALMERTQRQNGDRAAKLGMSVERVGEVDVVVGCLTENAERQGYSPGIGRRELRTAYRLIGDDNLRLYCCFDAAGRPASSVVVLHSPGTRAYGWLFGTKTAYLAQGAGHLIWRYVFDDIGKAGATGLDFAGPNGQGVATFKSRWGSRLAPIYSVRSHSIRAGARFVFDWINLPRSGSPGTGQPQLTSA